MGYRVVSSIMFALLFWWAIGPQGRSTVQQAIHLVTQLR